MTTIRHPAVAGMFYSSHAEELRNTVVAFLQEAQQCADLPVPKAIIVPHAGYIYSGQVAASAYACLHKACDKITRVVVLAPAHRYPVLGVAATQFDFFATPLGKIMVDHEAINSIVLQSYATIVEDAYNFEHAIEVQLPFLQILLQNFSLVPLLVGDATIDQVANVLRELWGDEETLIVISSDLSHFHDYEVAKKLDQKAAEAILSLNPKVLRDEQACGHHAVRGLLKIAAEKSLQPAVIDLRNSGDTAGSLDNVVGYGAFHFVSAEI